MNALVVREIQKANGTFGFELEHDEKGPKKREGAHQVKILYSHSDHTILTVYFQSTRSFVNKRHPRKKYRYIFKMYL